MRRTNFNLPPHENLVLTHYHGELIADVAFKGDLDVSLVTLFIFPRQNAGVLETSKHLLLPIVEALSMRQTQSSIAFSPCARVFER